MIKAGTKIKAIRKDKAEIITVGYVRGQLAIIDADYQIYYPSFYTDSDNIIHTPNGDYHVQEILSANQIEMNLDFLSPHIKEYYIGDVVVVTAPAKDYYKLIKINCGTQEQDVNRKINSYYTEERLIPVAVYGFRENMFLPVFELDNYNLYLNGELIKKLKALKTSGYEYISDVMLSDKSDSTYFTTFYTLKYDRMDYYFPLEEKKYKISDLIESRTITIDLQTWDGYKKFRDDYRDKRGQV